MKTLNEKIKKVLEEFDGKFNHFNSSVSGKQICDKYCDKAYDLEDVKSFLRSSIRKAVKESLKEVELKRKGNSLEKTLEEFVNNSNIHLGYNNAVSDQLKNHKKYLKDEK